MRYTTLIDISEIPAVYRSQSARLLYLHMAMKAGYHDNDRDILDASIRQLAAAACLTVSATRCALALLVKNRLIARQGSVWIVRKWIPEQSITSRPKSAREQKRIEAAAERKKEQEQRERAEAIERKRREELEATGKTSFMVYYESLLEKARAGDIEAQDKVKRHRETYEKHKAQFNQPGT